MSSTEQHIVCRRCGETVSMTVGSCPKCGAGIRGKRGPFVALVVGVVVLAISLTDVQQFWLFALASVFVGFGGAYFLYDRRRRIREAAPAASAE